MTRRIFCKVLLVAVAIFGVLVLSGVLSAQGHSDWAFERVKEVQERHTEKLMAKEGVEGTAIGYNQNDRLTVKVFTAGPGVRGIPKELDGVPVQVVVTGKFYALVDPTARFDRPVPTGVSTGHPDITAGTIGCRVYEDINGNGIRDVGEAVYALSNNHVYANENNAMIGDNVLQPGAYDGGIDPDDAIGTLADFETIDFSETANNTIDAAIALSSTDLLDNSTPSDGYGVPSSETVQPVLRLRVQKYGRTTGLTNGRISEINVITNVTYGTEENPKYARFVGQIAISPGNFSAGGDSGSLIVTRDGNNPVGLLFAGSFFRTIANPIGLVLDRFNVAVDDSAGPSNDPPTVSIINPADGSEFDSGAIIDFSGTASDTEDGDLTSSLVWTSSIDGLIGTGGSFSTALSDGNHTITAEVTDSGGKTGSDSISITVGTPTEVTVTGIDPATMQAGTTIEIVTISGSGFVAGAEVTLENGAGPAPTASNVIVVDGNTITATVTAKSGGPPRDRVWDVRVTNPDSSTGVLAGGFTVTP